MGKIRSCFQKEQPFEFYTIEYNGEVVATVRNLTLSEKGWLFSSYRTNPIGYKVARMYLALGGQKRVGREGWIFKEDVTEDVLNKLELDTPEIFWRIDLKLDEIEAEYMEAKAGILKNLNELSGSTLTPETQE